MNWDSLISAAIEVRKSAYAPYSGYLVGAAIEGADGRVWTGVNVENISYGLTVCAERAAVVKMVADGGREVVRVVVVTQDGGTPCGMCLQTLLEFCPEPGNTKILLVGTSGETRELTLHDLIPHGFRSARVKRTELAPE